MSVTLLDKIIGKTATTIEGFTEKSERASITFSDGSVFAMYHSQDCCESVDIESIHGDPTWLVGKPIVVAEIVDSQGVERPDPMSWDESFTWTFIKLGTNNGVITIRWYGSSNGYYCETPAIELDNERMYL